MCRLQKCKADILCICEKIYFSLVKLVGFIDFSVKMCYNIRIGALLYAADDSLQN